MEEVLEALAPQPGQIVVDGTLGAGGHTGRIADLVAPDGFVLAFDRDPAAIARAEKNLAGKCVQLAHNNYSELLVTLGEIEVERVNSAMLDLGLSSDQLADRERGFSFASTGPLDLRFNPDEGESAAELLQRMPEKALADLIYLYGEERASRRIARQIVARRREQPLKTATDLADLIRRCFPKQRHDRIDPATRTFQALRIAVNDELGSLEKALKEYPQCLVAGGKLAIISFHSLEDRLVKTAFRDDPRWEPITRKPITASETELEANPRSRSAKLRVAMRTEVDL